MFGQGQGHGQSGQGFGNLTDEILKAYIEQVFNKYDLDKNGTLDEHELTFFFNDLFKALNIPSEINKQQTIEAIKSMDQNSDGNIDKKQLFDAFKILMTKMNNPPPPPPHPYIHSYPYQPMYSYPPPPMPTQMPNQMYGQTNIHQNYNSMPNYGYQKQPSFQEQTMYNNVHNPYANQANQNKPNINNSGVKKSYGGGWSSKLK